MASASAAKVLTKDVPLTKDIASQALTNANVLALLKASVTYGDRIPEVTKTNIANIAETFGDPDLAMNVIAPALIELIGLQTINATSFRNPLAELKKAPMRFGATEQEIYVNMAKGMLFDNLATVERAFKVYRADIMAVYHHINFEQQYAVTITYQNLQTAFLSDYGLRDLISAKIESLYSGLNFDEFLCMKQLVDSAYDAGTIHRITVPEPDDDTSVKVFLRSLRGVLGQFKFPNPLYNPMGADSAVPRANTIILIDPDRLAAVDVESLAGAFNLSKIEIETRIVEVNNFSHPEIVAMVCDRRWFNVREHFQTMTRQQNGASLNTNFFLTSVQMISYSPFFPAVVFTTADTSVTAITIEDASVARGAETRLVVDVTGVNPNKSYDLTLSGANSQRTYIVPGTSILVVGQDETATTLSVVATSRADDTKTATATITLTGDITPVGRVGAAMVGGAQVG